MTFISGPTLSLLEFNRKNPCPSPLWSVWVGEGVEESGVVFAKNKLILY